MSFLVWYIPAALSGFVLLWAISKGYYHWEARKHGIVER